MSIKVTVLVQKEDNWIIMSSKYPVLSPNKNIKALEKIEFRNVSQKAAMQNIRSSVFLQE